MLLTQYLVCGSYVPSAGLLGNYVGGLAGGSALKALQARDYTSDTNSGEEYAYEHYDGEHEDHGKNLDDEQFTGKHDLTEEVHDTKDHSDFSSEHEAEAEHHQESDYHQHESDHHESDHHQHESEPEYNHHDEHIPEHHYAHDDEKTSSYEPNESKMLHHPALDFDSSEFIKKIYHGKGGFSYSTLYDNP